MHQNILSRNRALDIQGYFARIYNYMAGGLLMSAICAWLSVRPPLFGLFYKASEQGVTYSLLGWISILAPLIIIFLIGHAINKLKIQQAKFYFWLFSALMGISMGNIFLLFSGSAIFQAFLVTAGSFLGLSLYGYTTKRDLSSWGSFFVMGLIGVIIASLINLFIKSSQFDFVLNIIALLIFVGLTAYDTNKLRAAYNSNDSDEIAQGKAIYGALNLYLDFINLFRLILYFLNNRK